MEDVVSQECQRLAEVKLIGSGSCIPSSDNAGCSRAQGILPVILANAYMSQENAEGLLTCFCNHQFWVHVLQPLFDLMQQSCTTLNGAIKTAVVDGCPCVVAFELQSHSNAVAPSIETLHWFRVIRAMWNIVREVANFFHLAVSAFEAKLFHPSFVTDDGRWHCMAECTEICMIQSTTEGDGSVDGLVKNLLEFSVTTQSEATHTCRPGEQMGTKLKRLWSEFCEFAATSLTPPAASAYTSCDATVVKEEVEATELKFFQCYVGEQAPLLKDDFASEPYFREPKPEPRRDVPQVMPGSEHHLEGVYFENGGEICSPGKRPTAYKGQKKRRDESVVDILQLCSEYNSIINSEEEKARSPFRKFHFGGRRTLVECPVCCKPFKGKASDMLDLCLHIKRGHRESKTMLLRGLLESYSDRVQYMQRTVRDHASEIYRDRLRFKASQFP